MLRAPALIPLSHQHQHALALCVQIERSLRRPEADVARWNREAAELFADEVHFHFDAEETLLFPRARRLPGMAALVDELLAEHVQLRAANARAAEGSLDAKALTAFTHLLSAHIRKEERRLFEEMQAALPAAELEELGARLSAYFRDHGLPDGPACRLPLSGMRPPRV